jgi:hypothetical protein
LNGKWKLPLNGFRKRWFRLFHSAGGDGGYDCLFNLSSAIWYGQGAHARDGTLAMKKGYTLLEVLAGVSLVGWFPNLLFEGSQTIGAASFSQQNRWKRWMVSLARILPMASR